MKMDQDTAPTSINPSQGKPTVQVATEKNMKFPSTFRESERYYNAEPMSFSDSSVPLFFYIYAHPTLGASSISARLIFHIFSGLG